MATPAAQTLRYVLPTTAVRLSAQVRLSVVPDAKGGHLEPQVAARIVTRGRRTAVASVHDVALASPPAWAKPGSLRRRFDRENPRTAALIADLSARSEQFLAGLRMGENTAEVITFGQALEVVHRELAGADRMRREWIALQGRAIRTATWDVDDADLLPLEYPAATLPADVALPGGDALELAQDFGLLLASVSHDGHGTTLAVYRRAPRHLPDVEDTAGGEWVCEPALSHLRLLDTPAVPRPRDGEEPAGAEAAEALGLHTVFEDSPVDLARRQLALLDASDEYSRLASTHERTEELAALELLMRLGEGRPA